jgi:hypothetical protein
MGRLIKAVWLVVASAGSAGLILWMSEHGDLGSKMSGAGASDTEPFKIQE